MTASMAVCENRAFGGMGYFFVVYLWVTIDGTVYKGPYHGYRGLQTVSDWLIFVERFLARR